jgi:hypothetical protein
MLGDNQRMSPKASPRWQGWWDERGKRELATLLLERWDAFDLRVIVGNRLDEYESEAEQVGQVLQRGASADAVAEVLDAIVRRNGPAMGDPDNQRDRRAAREIVEWYSRTAVS